MYLYLVQFHCREAGAMRWLAESVSEQQALAMADAFKREGTAFAIHRVRVTSPGFLLLLDKNRSIVEESAGTSRKKNKKLATV